MDATTFSDQIPLQDDSHDELAGGLRIIDLLLRDRTRFLALFDDERMRPTVARALLVAIFLGAAVFGASIGTYRGGAQTFVTALKLPLVELITAILCAPALSALNAGSIGHTDVRRDFLALLSAFAMATLVLAGLAPVMLLARCYDFEYHRAILLLIGCCATGGIFGVSLLMRAMPRSPVGSLTVAAPVILGVLLIVGTQVSWTFRPYIGRPSQQDVPLLRSSESTFFDAAATSVQSAEGRYRSEP